MNIKFTYEFYTSILEINHFKVFFILELLLQSIFLILISNKILSIILNGVNRVSIFEKKIFFK